MGLFTRKELSELKVVDLKGIPFDEVIDINFDDVRFRTTPDLIRKQVEMYSRYSNELKCILYTPSDIDKIFSHFQFLSRLACPNSMNAIEDSLRNFISDLNLVKENENILCQ